MLKKNTVEILRKTSVSWRAVKNVRFRYFESNCCNGQGAAHHPVIFNSLKLYWKSNEGSESRSRMGFVQVYSEKTVTAMTTETFMILQGDAVLLSSSVAPWGNSIQDQQRIVRFLHVEYVEMCSKFYRIQTSESSEEATIGVAFE